MSGLFDQKSAEERLRILFRRNLRKGFIKNVEMDPIPPAEVAGRLEIGELPVLVIKGSKGQNYWFTSTRVLLHQGEQVFEHFRFDEVEVVHPMFKGVSEAQLSAPDPWSAMSDLKYRYRGHLEVETTRGVVAMDGLDGVHGTILHFLSRLPTPSRQS